MIKVFCAAFVAALFIVVTDVSAKNDVQATPTEEGQGAAVSALDTYYNMVEELLAGRKSATKIKGPGLKKLKETFAAMPLGQQVKVKYMLDTDGAIYRYKDGADDASLKEFEKKLPAVSGTLLILVDGKVAGIVPHSTKTNQSKLSVRPDATELISQVGLTMEYVESIEALTSKEQIRAGGYGVWADGGVFMITTK